MRPWGRLRLFSPAHGGEGRRAHRLPGVTPAEERIARVPPNGPLPTMTPGEFIGKWRASNLKERSGSQEHFIDLWRLPGEPASADAVHQHDRAHCPNTY